MIIALRQGKKRRHNGDIWLSFLTKARGKRHCIVCVNPYLAPPNEARVIFVRQGEDRREYRRISKGFNAVWRKSNRFKLYGFIAYQY